MSTVFRARDRHTNDFVAVKVMSGADASDNDRFQREARMIAELQHPGIVRYVAHGMTPAGERYLAMEWLSGMNLAQRIERFGGLGISDSVALTLRVAEVLGAAHRRNVIHRDLKPSNLFLVNSDLARVKLLDFGVARPTVDSSGVTLTGVVVGTPSYMSPEQARAGGNIDTRSDVYALGCLLFYLVAGRPPFVAASPFALLARLAVEVAPRVRTLRPEVPDDIDELLACMLAAQPEDRPRDANEVVDLLAEIPIVASDDAAPRRQALTRTERRLACTIVASDPIGSVPVEHDHDAVARAFAETVQHYGGRVDVLAGSTAVSFSTSGSATELAVRAARCALAMRELFPEKQLAIRTSWGEDTTRKFAMNLATRGIELLEDAHLRASRDTERSGPAPVFIDEMTAGLLDTRFELRNVPPYFELRAERKQNVPVRTLMGRPSRFLGREREMTTLRALYDECAGEPVSRAVLVTGPAGSGKSRLRFEFAQMLAEDERAPALWSMRGDAISAGAPLGLLVPLLRQVSGVVDGEPSETQRSRLRARVARAVQPAERERVTEFLGELIGLPPDPHESIALKLARRDAALMNDQMRRAWEDLLHAECRQHPVVLVVEDVQWGDLPTLKWIDAALRTLFDQPFMVLAFARPEVHDAFPNLWREREVQEIRLAPLTRRAAERLVRDALGEQADEAIVSRLVDQSGGNALYLEELIRATATGAGDRAPGTVLAMVQERIEALDAEGRRVLRAASIFGHAFWRSGVAALLGGEDAAPELDQWLEQLSAREMIFRRGDGRFRGEVEYVFRHALLRDGAYGMLTERDRVVGHRLAAEWLERAGEHQARNLAQHYERGEESARAAEWYLAAAMQAWEANDFGAVIAFSTRATALDSRDAMFVGRARRLQAEAHRWRGEHQEALRTALEAMSLLPAGYADWFAAAGEAASAASRLGEDKRVADIARGLEAYSPTEDVIPPFVFAAGACVVPLLSAGRREQADRLLAHLALVADPFAETDHLVSARLQRLRGFRALVTGDAAEYLRLTDLAAREYARVGSMRDASALRSAVGYAWILVGHFEESERLLRETLAEIDRLGIHGVAPVARHNLGWAVACSGRPEEGLEIEREAVAEAVRFNDRRVEMPARIYVAQILAMLRRYEEAHAELTAVIATANPALRASAKGVLARVLVAMGRGTEAFGPASEAFDALERIGGIEDGEALIRLAWAEALWARGLREEARLAIEAACDRLVQRAAAISDATLREAFLDRVQENVETTARAREWSAE